MSDPTTTNAVATAVNDAIKAGMSGGLAAAEAAAIADQPWLGLPVINQIFEYVLGLFENYLYEQAAMSATKLVIDIQTGVEASAAAAAFQNLQNAVASGDPNAIQAAKTSLDAAFGNVINYDGSASP